MKNIIQTVDFHGQSLLTIQHDGKPYVGMKAVCENIGLNWQGQYERLQRHEVLNSTVRVIRIVAEDRKARDMICLPLDMLNGWLFGVDVSRIKRAEVRERLLQYQRECFSVLYDYWHKGEAKNPRAPTPDERAGLRAAVTMLTTKRGLMHDEAYRLVHQRFNVDHIDKLTREQLPEAVEYVQRLALSGELLPRHADTDGQLAAVVLMHTGALRYRELESALERQCMQVGETLHRLKQMRAALDADIEAIAQVADLTRAILRGKGAIWDGLHESLFHLMLPDDVMEEGWRRAQKHYKPRILG